MRRNEAANIVADGFNKILRRTCLPHTLIIFGQCDINKILTLQTAWPPPKSLDQRNIFVISKLPNQKTEPSVGPAVPLYDLTHLHNISNGKMEIVKKLVSVFVKEVTAIIPEFSAACELKDYDKLKMYAHKLKPSVYNIGITSIKDDLVNIENAKNAFTADDQLREAVTRVTDILTKVISQLRS